LVTVLLLVAGLVVTATALVTLSVSRQRAAARIQESEARREALDGALRVALAEIAFGKAEGPFWHPRVPRTVTVGARRVEVTLERESGRIDLNTADARYIAAALIAAGLKEPNARAGAARIRDWIDDDDSPDGRDGAEREQYRRAGLPYGPRNGPMEAVDETRQVMGLGELSDDALDAFTVYSQQKEPFASEAPPAVRRALQLLDEGVAVMPAALPNANDPVSYAGSVIRLRACVEGVSEGCRSVVVRVTGSKREPWQTMSWR
jgi:general secretion pathway protein K